MDDITTIIYILIGVLYLIVRAFKKKKAPVPPTQQTDEGDITTQPAAPQRKRSLTFEELLKEISGQPPEEEEEPEEEETPPQPVRSDEEVKSTYQKSIEDAKASKKGEREDITQRHIGRFDVEVHEEETETSSVAKELAATLRNTDGIRKAIILKEILDRKYD